MKNDKIINIDGNWVNPVYIVSLQPALTYPNYEADPTKTLLEQYDNKTIIELNNPTGAVQRIVVNLSQDAVAEIILGRKL